jgi:DNA-binding response OmpR family regulator
MRLLLIEDDERIGKFTSEGLREAGHLVEWAQDGEQGLAYARQYLYDVIVLDLLLPKMDGWDVMQKLRNGGVKTPILVLTARDAVQDKVRGLYSGADDYLVKPFDFSELMARIYALTRRPPLQLPNVLHIGDLEIDMAQRTVLKQGEALDLSLREYMLLEYLMQNAGQILTRKQIGARVWGADFIDDSNVVDVYIGYLRRKVDKNLATPLIRTVRGAGYRFAADDPDHDQPD